MNVSVSQCPIGTSPTKRCPRGFQPLDRTMLVETAVSSINTRRAESSKPCSRTQRRPARATSARFRSAACRLFFDGDAVAGEESGKRASAFRDSPLLQRQDHLIQDEVRLLTNESEDALRVLLQWRGTPSTRHWLGSPVVKEALHPPDRGTDADVELVCRLTPGPSSLIETCKRSDVDPPAWLADILARLPDHPAKRIDELLPWNWKRAREQK